MRGTARVIRRPKKNIIIINYQKKLSAKKYKKRVCSPLRPGETFDSTLNPTPPNGSAAQHLAVLVLVEFLELFDGVRHVVPHQEVPHPGGGAGGPSHIEIGGTMRTETANRPTHSTTAIEEGNYRLGNDFCLL